MRKARAALVEAKGQVERALAALDNGDQERAVRLALKADTAVATALVEFAGLGPSAELLRSIIERVDTSMALSSTLADKVGKAGTPMSRLRPRLHALAESLAQLKDAVGPLQAPKFVFDPAGFHVIAHVAATALLAQEAHSLTERPRRWGSGIYALFYDGPLGFYAPLAGTKTPIYVGSAAPAKHTATTPEDQGESIAKRLMEHRDSIREVEAARGNLKVAEFKYRYLVVKSGWELAAEQYLIRFFHPVWNKETKVCTGIGKHGDASVTRANTRSQWDTVHPGRPWAQTRETKPNKLSAHEIQTNIRAHLERNPPRTLKISDLLELGETHPETTSEDDETPRN